MSRPAPKRGRPRAHPFAADEFKEGDHPRAPDGKFGSGGGNSAPRAKANLFAAPSEIEGGTSRTAAKSAGALGRILGSAVHEGQGGAAENAEPVAKVYRPGTTSLDEPAGEHHSTDEGIELEHGDRSLFYDLAYHHDGDVVHGHVHNIVDENGEDAFDTLDRVQAYKLRKALQADAKDYVSDHAETETEGERWDSLSDDQRAAEIAAQKAARVKEEAEQRDEITAAVEKVIARGAVPEPGKNKGFYWRQIPELSQYASPSSQAKIRTAFMERGHATDGCPAMAEDRATVWRRSEPRIALDRATVRRVDPDSGHLHVSRTPISKANVCPYYGHEIPGWQALGLTADRTYKLYRHPDELRKAVDTVNGKPLLIVHKVSSADDHPHRETAGAVNNAEWSAPYVMGGLDVWTKDAIDGIESGDRQELSPGYAYDPDMTPGTAPSGERYDGLMRNIRFNHVALVQEGRTGRDVYVHDAALIHRPRLKDLLMAGKAVPSRSAAAASSALSGALHGALLTYARPKLAADAKLDVKALLKGVTVKNVKTKAPAIAKAFDAAVKKLAKDAEVEQADVQDIVEQVGEMIAENAPDIAASVEPDASAADDDDADLKAMLKAKGFSDDEVNRILAMEPGKMDPVSASAVDVEKEKATEIKQAVDAAVRSLRAEMVTKTAQDAAIEAAVDGAVAAERQRNKDIREAEAHVAASPVGKLAGAFDSAPDVFRAGLAALGVKDPDKLHDSALRAVFDAHAGLKAAQTVSPALPHLASDSGGARKGLHERFPNLQRLRG